MATASSKRQVHKLKPEKPDILLDSKATISSWRHTLLITLKTRGSPPYFTAAYRKKKEIFVLRLKSAQCSQGVSSTDHFTDVRLVAWPLNENAALKANSMIIHTSSCPYSTLNTRGHNGHGLVALLLLGGEARTSKFVMLLAFCVKGNKKPINQGVFKISRWNKTTENHLCKPSNCHTTEKPVSLHKNLISTESIRFKFLRKIAKLTFRALGASTSLPNRKVATTG